MKTRNLDFKFRAINTFDGYHEITCGAVHDAGTLNYRAPEGDTGTITSGNSILRAQFAPYDGFFEIFANDGDFTSEVTEIEFTGPVGYNVGQLPPSLVKFHTEHEGAIMGGNSLPTGMVDLSVANLRSQLDADRIIQALEANGQTNGYVRLGIQVSGEDTQTLLDRGWTVEVEPQYAAQYTQSQTPHTYLLDGKPRHAVNRKRFGTRRKQRPKYGINLNGSSEYLETGSNALTVNAYPFSVSAWFRQDVGATGNNVIFALNNGINAVPYWAVANNNTTNFIRLIRNNGGTVDGDTALATTQGQWHHVFVECVSDTVTNVWLDGVKEVLTLGAVDIDGAGFNRGLVGILRTVTAAGYFAGDIDGVMFWNGATIADSEIQALARLKPGKRLPKFSVQPELFYKFDDPRTSQFIRNHGSLGSGTIGGVDEANLTINGTVSNVRGSVSDRYCFANEQGYSPSFTTDGVDDYIDTQETLNGATAFTVWRRARYLSNFTYDLDGFMNSGASTVRIGRNTGDYTLAFDYGDANLQVTGVALDLNKTETLAMTSEVGGNYNVRLNNALVASGTATGFAAISNTYSYRIGINNGASPANPGHCEYHEYLIANRVLTNGELLWLETGGESGTPIDFVNDSSILVYYDFADQDPYVVKNLANADQPGIISGGEWTAVGRDESDKTKDITGRSLVFTGEAPRDPVILSPCLELDGSSEYVDVPNHVIPAGDFTLACRFRADSKPGVDAYICGTYDFDTNNRSAQIAFLTSGHLVGYISVDGLSGGGSSFDINDAVDRSDGLWHEVVLTFDDATDTARLYIDGELRTTLTDAGMDGGAFQGTVDFRIGAKSGALARYFEGEVADVRVASSAVTHSQIKARSWVPDMLHIPAAEESGEWCWDVSGRGYHGSNAPTDRSGRQDFVDYPITNGWAKGTWYDGTNDYYLSSAAIIGGGSRLSISARFFCDSFASIRMIASEYDSTNNERSWAVLINTSGKLAVSVSSDGTGATFASYTTSRSIVVDKWYHVMFTFDAGIVKFVVNGVEWAMTASGASVTAFSSQPNTELGIGARADASPAAFSGILSQVLLHKNIAWTDEQRLAIAEANALEIPNLVNSFGGTSWFFRDGNGTEVIQGQAMNENGAPEARTILPSEKATYELITQGSNNQLDLGDVLVGATEDFDISMDVLALDPADGDGSIFFAQRTSSTDVGRMHLAITASEIQAFVHHASTPIILSYAVTTETDRWYTVRFTRVGDVFTLFVDGTQQDTDTQSSISVFQSNTTIGGPDDPAQDNFTGRIRNFRAAIGNESYEYLTAATGVPYNLTSNNVDVVKTSTVPIAYGPGKRAPLQEWLLDGDEANSSFALRYTKGVGVPYEVKERSVFSAVGVGYVDLGASLIQATEDFDISCGFRFITGTTDNTVSIISQYTSSATPGRMQIGFDDVNMRLSLFVDHATTDVLIYSANNSIEFNRYYTVRATRQGDVFTFYIDGVQVGQQTQSGISVESGNTFIWNNWAGLDKPHGNVRDLLIISGTNRYEYLREGIGLPGATLTSASLVEANSGVIANSQVFAYENGDVNVYEEPMPGELASLIITNKYR